MGIKRILIVISNWNTFGNISHHLAAWIKGLTEPVAVTLLAVVDEGTVATASAFGGYFDIPREPERQEIIAQKAIEERGRYLEELEALFRLEGVATEKKVRLGKLSEEVAQEAVEGKAYAIAVLADRRSRLFSTSTVEEIIRSAPCPVIVFSPRLVRFSESKKALASKAPTSSMASVLLGGLGRWP